MARIELMPETQEDFDRILRHLVEHDATEPGERILEIIRAIDVLSDNPLIGRAVSDANRELVIGPRRRGYLALYRYVEEVDTIFVLAVRSQKEAGYSAG